MLRYLTLALAAGLAIPAASAQAQQAPAHDTILVFDGSGSMWGQIDGVAKITIARDVVQGLLDELPEERRMGLVAYGHNRKGDCSDIETLVQVGADRDAIGSAIAAINPKGMTPMTAAVEQAAEALKFTENEATVILVSDGQETCHADPCQAAASLAKLGVGLTVHTVGFGLGAEEAGAKGELSCIAEATGGHFFVADDASELRAALNQISAAQGAPPAAAEPAPAQQPVATVAVTLEATDQVDGPVINDGLEWTVRHGASGEILYQASNAGTTTVDLPRGVHDVTVRRLSDGVSAQGEITSARLRLPLVVKLGVSISAPDTGAAGSTVRVVWDGPDEDGDYISVARPGSSDTRYETYTYTREGNPMRLQLPADPGEYELRYISHKLRRSLERRPITVTAVDASVDAPATGVAGETVSLAWTGPGYDGDYISVATPAMDSSRYETYTYTRLGNPLQLRLPAEPGTYEVRYIQGQGHRVLAREPVTVSAVTATLEVPASATVGSTVSVGWTGPDYAGDYISVARPDANDSRYEAYTYTRQGNPLQLPMPRQPGTYEVRYIQAQKHQALVRETIEVTAD